MERVTASSQLGRPILAILALVLVGMGLLMAPEPARAHSMHILDARQNQMFVDAGSFSTLRLYSNIGPSNVDWTIDTQLGLIGGDRYQNVYFYYYLYDRAILGFNIIGRYSVPVRDWVQVGPYVFAGPISSHAGGNI